MRKPALYAVLALVTTGFASSASANQYELKLPAAEVASITRQLVETLAESSDLEIPSPTTPPAPDGVCVSFERTPSVDPGTPPTVSPPTIGTNPPRVGVEFPEPGEPPSADTGNPSVEANACE